MSDADIVERLEIIADSFPMDSVALRGIRDAMKELTSLRTELAAMRERVEWRSIETAPRDGTAVDIWCVHPDGKPPSFRAAGVFWSGDLCKWIGIGGHWKITHWLPLPPIPTDTPKETGE